MLAGAEPKALLKSSSPATPTTSAAEAALSLLLLTARLEVEPFQNATIARVFQQPVKPGFKTLCDREIERFNELPDYLSALGWSK